MRLNKHENTAKDYSRARKLRTEASPIERKLWSVLRQYAATKNLKFRRQQVAHPYIADFACMEARLLIEIDGPSHDGQQSYDKFREIKLEEMEFLIMRFTNQDVTEKVEGVVLTIVAKAEQLIERNKLSARSLSPLPNPPREGEGTSSLPATR